MKSIYMALAAVLLMAASAQAIEKRDTIITIIDVNSNDVTEQDKKSGGEHSFVEILEGTIKITSNGISIGDIGRRNKQGEQESSGCSGDGSMKKKCNQNDGMIIGGLGFGLDYAVNRKGGMPELTPGKSFSIDWLYAVGYKQKFGSSAMSVGVGFRWNNYWLAENQKFEAKDGALSVTDVPEQDRLKKSNIHTFAVQFPLLWAQTLPVKLWDTKLEVTFGPIATLTSSATVKNDVMANGAVQTLTKNALNQYRPFSIDLFGALKFFDLGSFYVRYSPQSFMKSTSSINFNTLTTGFMFFL